MIALAIAASSASLMKPPVPIGAPADWVSFGDYPPRALRAEITGVVNIALHSGPASPGRKGPKIVFHAKDVAAMREELVARGASFGKAREGEFHLCDGKDPDSNPIQLSNR